MSIKQSNRKKIKFHCLFPVGAVSLLAIPFHLEIHHNTEVSCNFRFTGTLILIFFKVLKLEIPVS